ncbi:MAG: porin [Planctomycetaceae bacterium]
MWMRSTAAALLFLTAGGFSSEIQAQQSAETAALLQRLEQAESEIRELRSTVARPTAGRSETYRPESSGLYGVAFLDDESPIEGGTADPFAEKLMTLSEQQEALGKSQDDLKKLQDELKKSQKETADGLKDLSGKFKKGFVLPGHSNGTLQLNGRIHGDYWAFPNTDAGSDAFEHPLAPGVSVQDRFQWRRVRFGVKGDINDHMTYKIEMEFADPGSTQYRDVFVGFTNIPGVQTLLIGNQKRPYGLDHLNSSRYNVFLERPFIVEAFNQDARRLGACVYGTSEDEVYNWRYGVYNMELTQNDAGYTGDSYQLELAGRLATTYWYDETSGGRGYGHFALAGTIARPDGDRGEVIDPGPPSVRTHENEARFRTRPEARTDSRWLDTGRIAGADWYEIIATESVLNIGEIHLVSELQHLYMQREGEDLHFWGGYVHAAYFLTGEHMPWERSDGTLGRIKPFENFFMVDDGGGWGAWQIAARYSYADLTNKDIAGGIGQSGTLGLNWYWNQNARLQFNYTHGYISNHAPVAGNTSGHYDIIGTRFSVDF